MNDGEGVQLPSELYVEVFAFLDAKDLCTMRLVNRRWFDLSSHGSLWKDLYKKDFEPFVEKASGEDSWFDTYRRASKWAWDKVHKHPSIKLLNRGKTAKNTDDGSYRVVRSNKPATKGVHYFEVVVGNINNKSVSQSIGLCCGGIKYDSSHYRGWGGGLNGIGWYRNGNIHPNGHSNGQGLSPGFNGGDRLGVLLTTEGTATPYVYFYLNRRKATDKLYIHNHDTRGNHFYLHCFLVGDSEFTLAYAGAKPSWIDVAEEPLVKNTDTISLF